MNDGVIDVEGTGPRYAVMVDNAKHEYITKNSDDDETEE